PFPSPSSVHHPALPSFPTRRSSDLVRAEVVHERRVRRHFFLVHAKLLHDDALHLLSNRHSILLRVQTAVDGQNLTGNIRRFVRRSEEHTSELQSREKLVCRLLLEKK